MKKILTTTLGLVLILTISSCNSKKQSENLSIDSTKTIDVLPGQIWTKVDSANPFEKARYDTIVVLETKNGYSKVIWNGDTISMKSEGASCCGATLMK